MADTRCHVDLLLVMTLEGAIGGVTGFALWMATETFLFLPILLAIGLVTGISIAETRLGR